MNSRNGEDDSGDALESTAARRKRDSLDDDDSSGYKRQRTALACNSCRYRKSRCNGVRPVCATCTDMGFECVYRRPAPAPKPEVRDMASLANRLQMVEVLLRSIADGKHGNTNQTQASLSGEIRGIRSAQRSAESELHVTAGFHTEQPRIRPEESMTNGRPTSQEDTVDGMGIITFADESTTSGHFGPSSNSSFFGHVARALAAGTDTMEKGKESSRDLSRDLAASISRPASPPLPSARPSTKTINPYVLPSRTEIRRLVESFFSTTGMFFPYIHKTKVLEMIEKLDVVKFTGVRKSWLCLLNAILAIGTSLDGEKRRQIKFRETESDLFFQRALVLSPWTISNTANLETLQALAVLTQYLQGTSRSAQTWRLHGLLVQAAFQMGVHVTDTTGKLSVLEQEIRTRTWFTCIVLDRVLSMTFGRPPLIHNELIQIDLPRDIELDDLVEDDGVEPRLPQVTSEPSSCALFIYSIKLYRIQGDIIREVYNQNLASSKNFRTEELFSQILRLDHDLTQWKQDLHPSQSLAPVEDVGEMHPQSWAYTRTQTVLTLRYLSVRLLLYRKLLENSLDEIAFPTAGPESDCFPPIVHSMLQMCISSATKIITLIRRMAARPHMLPAWWFTAYHVFNAALIIFGVICMQTVGKTEIGSKTPVELVQCLRVALDALDIVGKETRIVRRCSKYLRKLIRISSSLVRNHTSTQPDLSGQAAPVAYENPPSTTDESTESPLDAEFGQFLIDEDFNFLDFWTDLAQQPIE